MIKREVEPVVLVTCPPWGINFPPLALGYLKSFLENRGRTVYAIDFNVEIYHRVEPQYQKYWLGAYLDLWSPEFFKMMGGTMEREITWCVERVSSLKPRVVGFSVNQSNLYFSFEIAKRLKKNDSGLIIIFGGPGVYWVDRNRNMPIGILDEKGIPILPMEIIDVFVHGDGEEALEEILHCLELGEDLRNLKSITTRVDGQYLTTGPRHLNLQLDQYPLPVFEWVNFDAYHEIELGIQAPARIVPIILSRGCINSCRFCNDWIMQGRYRFRNPQEVFDEMRHRVLGEEFSRFYFCDLLVNGNLEQLKTLAELIVRSQYPRRYNLVWSGQAIARREMDIKYLKVLRDSGCEGITYGVESMSDKVLQVMHKNITVEDIESVLKTTKSVGIPCQINLIVGYPGEGEREFQETFRNLKRLARYIDRVSSLSMLTMTYGSPLFKRSWRKKGDRHIPDWHRQWVVEEDPTNTFEIRDKHFKQLQTVLGELGLMTLATQHYEDAFAQAKQELKES